MKSNYTPYKFWDRTDIVEHLTKQCYAYKQQALLQEIMDATFDKRWNPIVDYNGCNIVQDKYHPFVPCFIHDYGWNVEGRTLKGDLKFRDYSIRFGKSKLRANIEFVSIVLGYYILLKWL